MSKEDIRELAEDNAIYEFNKFKKIYGNYTDEYVRHFYNKLAELRGGVDDVHACNCKHNSNSRDNEPCCRCDSRQTNADRIRNMSDEELAEFLITFKNTFGKEYEGETSCMEWLQSESRIGENMEDRYLFKAKRIDNREWEIGNLIALPTGDYEISNKCNNPPDCDPMWDKVVITHKVDPTTICQCTGLKDKNGKLIWGNDIVDGHIKRGAAFLNCLVLWNESKARFDVRAKGCNFPMTLDEVAGDISVGGLDYEVVGNIFDNPELLESEEN